MSEQEDANWEMVRSSLAAMSQAQSEFFKRVEERLHGTDLLLIERFDALDRLVADQTKALVLQTDLLENLNQILAGVRSATDSNYDMVTTAAKKIERVRKFLKVPDAVANGTDSNQAPSGEEAGDGT